MKPSMLERLDDLRDRLEEVGQLLSEPDASSDQNRFRDLSREYAELGPVVDVYSRWQAANHSIAEAEEMRADPEMRELANEELEAAQSERDSLESELQLLLLPRDPRDQGNIYLEVRAGTGGDEAALFAGDLFRMYLRYAERRRWSVELLSESEGEHGGYKEVVARIIGDGVYSRLKFESGAHRVQRVPETESQGRIHTSACTVAILPEVENVEEVEINPSDLRVDTYRASGAGGQHINKTDSAIRITHLPTGVVVECQEERSQHKNRAKAMSLLASRLLAAEQEKQSAATARDRKLQVGSGDRSERIRTYNFPQGRVTDHRINLTLYRLEDVLAGDLDQLFDPLLQEHQAELLAEIGG